MSRINLKYSVHEGFKNFFLNGFMTFAAVGVIAACFLVTGSFTLLAFNIDVNVEEVEKRNDIRAYIEDSLSEDEAKALQSEIEKLPYISKATFISRGQALEEFKESLGDDSSLLDGLEEDNPLQMNYKITVTDIKKNEQVASEVAKIQGIDDVKNNAETSRRLINFRSMINAVCIALIAMLGGMSVFIIFNTVKIATFARREEIAIMKMVGATNWFVRMPFFIEGLLLGETGAVAAFFLQWGFYVYIEEMIGANSAYMIPFMNVFPPLAAVLAAVGIIVGAGGSLLAIRKFLKV